MDPSLYFTIMAGGRGTRFWPRSRTRRPKQLLNILGSTTILEQTVDRILPLTDWEHLLIVSEQAQAEMIRQVLPKLPPGQLIVEPVGRNTAPCVGLAALLLERRDPRAVMVALPADHFIADVSLFQKTLLAAAESAKIGDHLITLGIRPTGPETGYGYLERGEKIMEVAGREVWKVQAFHEKPDRQRAEAMLRSGNYFWNSGMFIWKASAILHQMARWTPALYAQLERLNTFLGTPDWEKALAESYPAMENISIDYAVMEKADNVLMLSGDFGWNDVGSWEAAYQLAPKDEQGNCFTGPVWALDSRGCLVYSPDKAVGIIGLKDLVVVETPDALLICPRERAQEVKKIVERLEEEGRFDLL